MFGRLPCPRSQNLHALFLCVFRPNEKEEEELQEADGSTMHDAPQEEVAEVKLEELSNIPPLPPEGPGPKDYQVLFGDTCMRQLRPYCEEYSYRLFV